MDFIKTILKKVDNQYASLASEGCLSDIVDWYDTGSYTLNAILSGHILRGLPSNKLTIFGGNSGTGKSFFTLACLKHFLDANPNNNAVFFESESAITSEMMEERGIDTSRVAVFPISTIEQANTQVVKVIKQIKEHKDKGKFSDGSNVIIVLDSLGMLSTTKEVTDTEKGEDKRDMTRAQGIKKFFRTLTLDLGISNIPMIITNHVYKDIASMGYSQRYNQSGGSGAEYAPSCYVFLSKQKEWVDKKQVGSIVHLKAEKSRIIQENSKADCVIYFDTGLDRYYGLFDLALQAGAIFKAESGHLYYYQPEGVSEPIKLGKRSDMDKDPESFWTDELLQYCDGIIYKYLSYGGNIVAETKAEMEEEGEGEDNE